MLTREVAENTPAGSAIGDPVVAEDEDGDILTYTLTGARRCSANFDIDRATGQIMTKAALDNETGPKMGHRWRSPSGLRTRRAYPYWGWSAVETANAPR